MIIYRRFAKRFSDLFLSLFGIFLFSPLFLLLILLVKFTSRGPIFFVQKRMGIDGKPFLLVKFRTMYSNSAKERLSFEPGVFDRITPVGKILRKTKLDELPQLINVLKGQMSFVGLRPEVFKYKNSYSGRYEKILSLRPGITDEASIKYRNEEMLLSQADEPERIYRELVLPDKLNINLEYAKKGSSLREDVKIILKTLGHIFSG